MAGSSAVFKRDAFFDNAKWLLIFLVVLGHLISPLKGESDFLYTMYNFIYTFHMPAFIFIAGVFSRGTWSLKLVRNVGCKILLPYFLFQILFSIFQYVFEPQKTFSIALFDPYWTLWFLLSLASWHLLLPLFLRFQHPLTLAWVIGLSCGYFSEIGSWLSLSRTFVFFPFFLLGHKLGKKPFERYRASSVRAGALAVLIALFCACGFLFPYEIREWLYGSVSYTELLPQAVPFGAVIRLGIYGLSALAVFAFLFLVPQKRLFLTERGAFTLYVYLLHGMALKLFFATPLFSVMRQDTPIILLLVLALGLTWVLSSRPVVRLFRSLIEMHRFLPSFQKGRLHKFYQKQKRNHETLS